MHISSIFLFFISFCMSIEIYVIFPECQICTFINFCKGTMLTRLL